MLLTSFTFPSIYTCLTNTHLYTHIYIDEEDYYLAFHYSTEDDDKDYKVTIYIDGEEERSIKLDGTDDDDEFEWQLSKKIEVPQGCFTLGLEFNDDEVYIDKVLFVEK